MMKKDLKLIRSGTVSLARMLGLVRRVRPVRMKPDRKQWGLLVEGRGFTRLLRKDVLPASPQLLRPMGWDAPRPEMFGSEAIARRYVEHMGWFGRSVFQISQADQ